MQLKKLPIPLTAMALALATAFSLPQTSLAEEAQEFKCGLGANGYPVTQARTEFGNVDLIYWERDMGGISAEKRCLIVSDRLEGFRKNNQLKYLRTGEVNGQPVICVTRYNDGSCSGGNILVTLQQKDDANQVLSNLINSAVRAGRGSSSVYLSPSNQTIEPRVQKDGFLSIDIQRLIDFHSGKGIPVLPQD